MITVQYEPVLVDYIRVALKMPEDEQKQLEAYTGQQFTVDGCAIGNFQVAGHKWGIYRDAEPLVIGGFSLERPGVYRDFLLTTPEAWAKENWFHVTRICRRLMTAMLASKTAHRLECITPAPRLASRPELYKWYRILGYNNEGVLHGYCANGADAVIFSRVKH